MNLTPDENARLACLTAEYVEMIEIGETVLGGTATYDAVGWASYDSVDAAL